MTQRQALSGLYALLTVTIIAGCGMSAQSTALRNSSSYQGMRLISAAGKIFQMGDSVYQNALPIHPVKFTRDFYMDTIEVTQADYTALMGVNPSFFSGNPRLP